MELFVFAIFIPQHRNPTRAITGTLPDRALPSVCLSLWNISCKLGLTTVRKLSFIRKLIENDEDSINTSIISLILKLIIIIIWSNEFYVLIFTIKNVLNEKYYKESVVLVEILGCIDRQQQAARVSRANSDNQNETTFYGTPFSNAAPLYRITKWYVMKG